MCVTVLGRYGERLPVLSRDDDDDEVKTDELAVGVELLLHKEAAATAVVCVARGGADAQLSVGRIRTRCVTRLG